MNSLETLKKELIKQKQLLDKKGFTVTVNNTNPSPSEITSAIEKINFDFSETTATEEDVKMGKTFYSQTNEVKTGTLDVSVIDDLNSKLSCLISGEGSMEIVIPSTISTIRKYAYYTPPNTGRNNVFYKENLTIPSNIKHIEAYAFSYSDVSGLVIIPETCEKVEGYIFRENPITEVIINGGLAEPSSYTYHFDACSKLEKATINQEITRLNYYIFNNCTALKELILPPTLSAMPAHCIMGCTALQYIKFSSTTPPTIDSTTFSPCKTAIILVPYEYYNAYFNSTNYQKYSNPIVGYGDFEIGSSLPTELNGFSFTWYSNLDDLNASTNPITTVSEAGTMYAMGTEIASEDTETT